VSATVAARGAFHPELRTLARFAPRGNVTNAAGLKVMRQLTGLRRPSTTDVEDVSLGAAARMRLFRGAVKPVVAPALLWMHGGGYVMGNAHMGDRLCRASAEALDITVASVEYRLAPEHPYPAAVDDCETALRHLAALPGVDPERVAIGGVSSGAGLAAALAIRLRDTADITPVRQLLAYPMLDDRTSALSHRHDRQFRFWNRRSNEYGWAAYLADTDPNRVVPARCSDLRGLPPAWIGVGALDLLHDENVAFAERLLAAGVPCDLCVVRDAFHGFDAVAPKSAVAQTFFARQCLSLSKAFQTA
jgi:acetyl esterase/lipase